MFRRPTVFRMFVNYEVDKKHRSSHEEKLLAPMQLAPILSERKLFINHLNSRATPRPV